MVKNWQGKRVLVMGLGLQGGGLQVVSWLLKQKADITVTDLKNKKQLRPTLNKISQLQGAKNIKYFLGKHDLQDFKDKDLIVQNPGVPAQSVYLQEARRNGIPIVNEAVMFFGLYPGQSIGVTGTRGKSTVTTLIHKILKTKIRSNVVAGNIATTPMFSVLDKLKKDSLPVLELSSWHLEGLAEYKTSPHIAVITNILVDHLNRYKSFAEYKKAKIAIIANQTSEDFAILNSDNAHTKNLAQKTKAKVYYFSLNKKVKGLYLRENNFYFNDGYKIDLVMPIDKVGMIGQHNLANIAAAVCVAKILKFDNKKIEQVVNKFRGIDYRLQFLGKHNNAEVFNDATASTPDATMAAIRAMNDKKTLLIAGGEDKVLDYKPLAKLIKQKIDKLILLSGSGSKKLLVELKKINYPSNKIISDVANLPTAWHAAQKHIAEVEVVLFSPATASFNMFVNEFERARLFETLVKDGQKKTK
jgi:UDP-N-acetylmuramoylalanine--D-glutamate ligase